MFELLLLVATLYFFIKIIMNAFTSESLVEFIAYFAGVYFVFWFVFA